MVIKSFENTERFNPTLEDFEKYRASLNVYARKLTKNNGTYKDVVQDTLLYYYKRLAENKFDSLNKYKEVKDKKIYLGKILEIYLFWCFASIQRKFNNLKIDRIEYLEDVVKDSYEYKFNDNKVIINDIKSKYFNKEAIHNLELIKSGYSYPEICKLKNMEYSKISNDITYLKKWAKSKYGNYRT